MRLPRTRRSPSGVEPLEERITLANDVQTSFNNGTLTITTVDQLGEAEILANDNDQSFSIVGTGLGTMTVNQTGVTTIDGGASSAFTGVTKIVVKLELGEDFVTVQTLDITGDFQFDGGEGGNRLTFDALAGATKLRNITATNGNGNDFFTLTGASTVIAGNVTLKNGHGGCDVSFGNSATDDVTIQGNVKVTNGNGVNVVSFFGEDVLVDGAVKLKSGVGSNVLFVTGEQSLTFAKPLSVVHGAGASTIRITTAAGTSTYAGVRIDHVVGESSLTFDGTGSLVIAGDLVINNRVGEDVLTIDTPFFTVEGQVKINNGAGDTTTDLSPIMNTVKGTFSLTNGAGTHTTTISGVVVDYQGVSIRSTAGDAETELKATSELSFGALKILNGEGADTLRVGEGSGVHRFQSIAISNGSGGGLAIFDPVSLTITGALNVTGLDRRETVEIGRNALDTFSIGSLKVKAGTLGAVVSTNPGESGRFEGGINIVGGSWHESLDLRRTIVRGAIKLNLGDGRNSVSISDSTIAALTVTTGSGDDTVTFEENSNTNVGTVLEGIVKIILGAGDDFVRIGFDTTDAVMATRPVQVDGGTHIDTLTLGLGNNFAVPLATTGFEVLLP